MKARYFRCKKCGKVIVMLSERNTPTICCGEEMEERAAGITEASREKHIPVFERTGNIVKVSVGSVAHPMEEQHFIEWIALESSSGVQVRQLTAGNKPEVVFALEESDSVERVLAFCNLHGLWASN